MVKKLATTLALITLVGAVSASASQRRENELLRDRPDETTTVVTKAPEIDPASAMVGLTLLAGGLAVLRGRKAKKTAE